MVALRQGQDEQGAQSLSHSTEDVGLLLVLDTKRRCGQLYSTYPFCILGSVMWNSFRF
jgi:hypothetical protein